MEDNQTDFDRLLAGRVASDDPALGRVANFLDQVQAAQALPDVEPVAQAHLLRMRQAFPLTTTESHPNHKGRVARRSRRFIIGAVAGILAGISAGIGVAAAAGTTGQPWPGWLPWAPVSASSMPKQDMSQASGPQSPSGDSTVPVTAPPGGKPTVKPTNPGASASNPAPENGHTRVADPGTGSVPSATTRGKSTQAPGHNKTPVPSSTKKTGKDRAAEAKDSPGKAS